MSSPNDKVGMEGLEEVRSQEEKAAPNVVRREQREKTLTESGADYTAERLAHHTKDFRRTYDKWKSQARATRKKLKEPCSDDSLDNLKQQIEHEYNQLQQCYQRISNLTAPCSDTVARMHTCGRLTQDIVQLVDDRRGKDCDRAYAELDTQVRLSKEDDPSVFGVPSTCTNCSRHSVESKRDAEADLAAKTVELEETKKIHAQQTVLSDMETELKAIRAETERKEALWQRELRAQRLKLEQMEAEKEYAAARARALVYGDEEEPSERPKLNPRASTFKPKIEVLSDHQSDSHMSSTSSSSTNVNEIKALASAIQNSLSLSRLPTPEPSVFSGDPLQYVRWKLSFQTLIEGKTLSSAEKMFFLQRYLGGSALKAVEGFFFTMSEDSYKGAWALLEERFGHTFKVQEAFRERLNNWPKIGAHDGGALQGFADFLKACRDASSQIPGLKILDDCQENQRLSAKLPDWVAAGWNRMVTEALEVNQRYPLFEDFVKFVSKEAQIACNPITSVNALRHLSPSNETTKKDTKPQTRARGTALATNTDSRETRSSSEKTSDKIEGKMCKFCKQLNHYIPNCPEFERESTQNKKTFIQEHKLCFGCLRTGHHSKDCKRRHTCNMCKGRHPTVLHEERPARKEASQRQGDQNVNKPAHTTVSCKVHLGNYTGSSMIVPVWVSSEQNSSTEVLTYALLDTQSDSSFILEDMAETLAVSRHPVNLKLATLTNSSTVASSLVSDLLIRGMNQSSAIRLKRCYTRDFIPADQNHIPSRKTAEAWHHLRDVAQEIPALQDCEVGLLIGYDCPQALAPRKTITGKSEEPYAVYTDLGWSIVGSAGNQDDQQLTSQCYRVATKEMPYPTPREALKILEADFAERHHEDKAYSQEDLQFIKRLEGSIRQCKDGHLEMPLPFRERPELPNNRKLAVIRLQHLKRKMDRDKQFKEHYTNFMREIIENQYAERASEATPEGSTNYIPHHGVYHAKKKDKIRVVFDCSAKFAQTSLNEHLLKGPDLINGLVGILCRFRKHDVALLCDIEKMFLQFRVCVEDRDFLRFLWWEGGDTSKEPVDYRMAVHLFGASSSPGCANFGLKYLARQHQETLPSASKFVARNFYVDDGVTSASNTGEAIKLAEDARELCKKGSLRLHKFVSNDRVVLESVPQSERSKEVMNRNLDFDEFPIERALGITWNPTTDTFCFKISPKEQPMTRRGILSMVASLYDPLGFVCPVILIGKRVLQEMCRSKAGWDDPIHEDLKPRWEQWRNELGHLESLEIPRCYHPPGFGEPLKVELHHFSDASSTGYGQCSYLRLINQEGAVHCCLVFAKSRVAPTKVVTIPRLELTAAVVAAKVSNMLRKELEYEDIQEVFWTDSRVILGYINNEARRFHTFVANRVQIIRERTTPDQWRYVSTEDNPADHASRGLSPADLPNTRWFQGPRFLWEKEIKFKEVEGKLSSEDPEVRAVVLASTVTPKAPELLERLSRFSDWIRMIKGLTRLRRLLRKGVCQVPDVQERRETETFILKLVQWEAFSGEIGTLGKGREVPSTSVIHNLSPFLDELDILRVGGRLGKSTLPEDIKNPVILPKNSHVTQLLVRYLHHKTQHQGRGQTLNEIRACGYWVLSGSKVVAEMVRNCVNCRRLRRPEEEQKMARLPEERVEPSPPFTYVGMDCFGPFKVKRVRSEVKRYGLLFTCLCSRGIHLEMLDDMSTDAFINGLRCFLAIRGPVRTIRCDQGSNFIGANNELNADKLKSYLMDRHCDFVFNAPHSSHAGGVWERQIKTVRNVLRATIDLASDRLDDSSLRTLLYEAMAIVNSRPLSVANLSDPLGEPPVTPNHLLTMKSVVPPPPGKFVKEDVYARKRWRRVQYLLEQFWSRWRKEYLLNLQVREKWTTPRRNLQVGDVVLLNQPDLSRMEWPIGIIRSRIVDPDGLVRRVRVQVASKDLDKRGRPVKEPPELERPIQKIVLLMERA